MIKELRREEIPDWDFGDVAIKTFSFGDQNHIAALAGKIRGKTIENADIELREDISIESLNVNTLASGIHYVKGKDNISFIIKPNLHRTDKYGFADKDISFQAGQYLVQEINKLNQPLTVDEKKN